MGGNLDLFRNFKFLNIFKTFKKYLIKKILKNSFFYQILTLKKKIK